VSQTEGKGAGKKGEELHTSRYGVVEMRLKRREKAEEWVCKGETNNRRTLLKNEGSGLVDPTSG